MQITLSLLSTSLRAILSVCNLIFNARTIKSVRRAWARGIKKEPIAIDIELSLLFSLQIFLAAIRFLVQRITMRYYDYIEAHTVCVSIFISNRQSESEKGGRK